MEQNYVNDTLCIDKYLDTLLASQTARKAMPPTTAKRDHRKMVDCHQTCTQISDSFGADHL